MGAPCNSCRDDSPRNTIGNARADFGLKDSSFSRSCDSNAVLETERVSELELEVSRLKEALQQTHRREDALVERARQADARCDALRLELRNALSEARSAESANAACQRERTEACALFRSALGPDRGTDGAEEQVMSLATLAAAVAARCGRRETQAVSDRAAQPLQLGKALVAAGTKVWRLQQSQRVRSNEADGLATPQRDGLSGANMPPTPLRGAQSQRSLRSADGAQSARGLRSGEGAVVSARGQRRPLYAVPAPAKKPCDDAVAQLLTEMSQTLREFEVSISLLA